MQIGPGRWTQRADASAWHEAGHIVVYLHLGWTVSFATIEPNPRLESVGRMVADPPPDQDPIQRWWVVAIGTMAGPLAVNAVRSGFNMPCCNTGELLSPTDFDALARAKAAVASDLPHFERDCRRQASSILVERQQVFAAFVRALLEHRTLAEHQILEIWQQFPIVATASSTPAYSQPDRQMTRQERRAAQRQLAKRNVA